MNKKSLIILFLLIGTVVVPLAYYRPVMAQIEKELALDFYYTAVPTVEQIAQIIKDSLEAAGIRVNMYGVDFNTLISTILAGKHHLSFFGFGLGRLPLFVLAFTKYSAYARFVWYWSNATVDALALSIVFADDNWTEVVEHVRAIQWVLVDQLPLIPIYQNQILSFYKNGSEFIGFVNLYGSGVDNSWTPLKLIKYDPEKKEVVYGEGNITAPLGYYPACLNPFSPDASAYDWAILDLIFGGLYAPNPYNASTYMNPDNVIYTGAEKIVYTPANVTVAFNNDTIGVPVGEKVEGYNITVKLREGLKWSDGTPVTADDLVFTYKFMWWLFEETGGDMGGFEDIFYFGAVCNVVKVNDTTVVVQVGTKAIIPRHLALNIILLPEHIWGDQRTFGAKEEKHFPDWDINGSTVVNYVPKSPDDPFLTGTGPFKLVSWDGDTPDTSSTFVLYPNENYFGYPYNTTTGDVLPGREWVNPSKEITPYGPYVKALTFKVITDPQALYTALVQGEIDYAAEFELAQYAQDLISKGFDYDTTPRLGFGHLSINCFSMGDLVNVTDPIATLLRNKVFRKAIALALDKERVVSEVWKNYAYAIDSPIPKSYNVWQPFSIEEDMAEHYYDAKPQEARKLLESLGLSDMDGDGIYELGYTFMNLLLPLWAFVLIIVAIVAVVAGVVYYVVVYRRKKLVAEATE